MPVPSMRATAVSVAVAIVLTGIGVALWQFVIRDESVSQEAEGEPKKEKREQASSDPVVRKMSVAEQARQVLMLGFEGTGPEAPGVADLAESGAGAVIVRSENWAGAEAGRKLVARIAQSGEIPPVV